MIRFANRCFPPMYGRGPIITKKRDVMGGASRIGTTPTEMPVEACVHLSRQNGVVKARDVASSATIKGGSLTPAG
jgi:hypothetical protein